ncbi:MAG: hypothetical protein R3E68_17580 [Burkholderiaceae bacterium]
MSSLSLTLLILVLLGVGGVAFYNFWVLRGQSRSLTNRLIDDLDDRPAARRPEPTLVVGDAHGRSPDDEPAYAMPGPDAGERFDDPRTPGPSPVPTGAFAGSVTPPAVADTRPAPVETDAEPVLAAPPRPATPVPAAVPVAAAEAVPPVAAATPATPAPARLTPTEPVSTPGSAATRSDPFHCELCITLPEPQAGERLMRLTRDMGRVGAKPVEITAHPVSADPAQFGRLHEDERYDALRYRLLLINRQGPLNAMEFSEFATHLQKLSDELDVLVDTPQMNEVLGRARDLDERIGALDAQIAVNVETSVPVSIDEFARAAARLELKEQANQRHVRVDDRASPSTRWPCPTNQPHRAVTGCAAGRAQSATDPRNDRDRVEACPDLRWPDGRRQRTGDRQRTVRAYRESARCLVPGAGGDRIAGRLGIGPAGVQPLNVSGQSRHHRFFQCPPIRSAPETKSPPCATR